MDNNSDLKENILKILKNNDSIWVSELQRELIRNNTDVSYPHLLDIVKQLEDDKKIISVIAGKNRVIKLVK